MNQIQRELEQIRLASGGILKPKAVVDYARKHTDSALHDRFDWDTEAAAEKWLLHQASEIIRATVTYIGDGPRAVRAYVSLDEDRKQGGGYRSVVDVAANDALRESMLAQARRDAQAFQLKYQDLEEYASVIAAMRETATA